MGSRNKATLITTHCHISCNLFAHESIVTLNDGKIQFGTHTILLHMAIVLGCLGQHTLALQLRIVPSYLQVVVLTTVLQIQPPLYSLLIKLFSVPTFQSMMTLYVKEMLMKLL